LKEHDFYDKVTETMWNDRTRIEVSSAEILKFAGILQNLI